MNSRVGSKRSVIQGLALAGLVLCGSFQLHAGRRRDKADSVRSIVRVLTVVGLWVAGTQWVGFRLVGGYDEQQLVETNELSSAQRVLSERLSQGRRDATRRDTQVRMVKHVQSSIFGWGWFDARDEFERWVGLCALEEHERRRSDQVFAWDCDVFHEVRKRHSDEALLENRQLGLEVDDCGELVTVNLPGE